MKSSVAKLILSAISMSSALFAQQAYIYTPVDVAGGTDVELFGLNSAGDVTGSYLTTNNSTGRSINAGFVRLADGTFIPVNDPDSLTGTVPKGVSDSNAVVGGFNARGSHGFVYGMHQFHNFNYQNYQTFLTGISTDNRIVGYYVSGPSLFGFYWDTNVKFKSLPNVNGLPSRAYGVNNLGQMVGVDAQSSSPGIQYDGLFFAADGSYVIINYPGAIATNLSAINDGGTVAGYASLTSTSLPFGFLYVDGQFTTFNYPGARQTEIYGINNAGVLSGVYQDSANIFHGFIATPIQ